MAVNPINTQIPVPQGDPAAAVRHRSHQAWMETVPGAGQLSRKDRNAIILATLANPGSRALPGAGGWTHQYAEPGNSACSDDQRVQGNLGVLWYGEPGPADGDPAFLALFR